MVSGLASNIATISALLVSAMPKELLHSVRIIYPHTPRTHHRESSEGWNSEQTILTTPLVLADICIPQGVRNAASAQQAKYQLCVDACVCEGIWLEVSVLLMSGQQEQQRKCG